MARYVFLFFLLIQKIVFAQTTEQNAKAILFDVSFGINQPVGKLSQRFGSALRIGSGINVFNIDKGFRWGINGNYFFGSDVKEDVIAGFRTPDGNILSDLNSYADIQLRERGLYLGADIGKIFKLSNNTGFFQGISLSGGVGFIMHNIRIQDENRYAQQLQPPYSAGYDRFTSGVATEQSLAYNYISHDKTINFFARLEVAEGYTRNQRAYNFDTHAFDTASRIDILVSVSVGWSIALFAQFKPDQSIEY